NMTRWRACHWRMERTHEHVLVVVDHVPGDIQPGYHLFPVRLGPADKNPLAAGRYHRPRLGPRRIARGPAPAAAVVGDHVGGDVPRRFHLPGALPRLRLL